MTDQALEAPLSQQQYRSLDVSLRIFAGQLIGVWSLRQEETKMLL